LFPSECGQGEVILSFSTAKRCVTVAQRTDLRFQNNCGLASVERILDRTQQHIVAEWLGQESGRTPMPSMLSRMAPKDQKTARRARTARTGYEEFTSAPACVAVHGIASMLLLMRLAEHTLVPIRRSLSVIGHSTLAGRE
jgi:hypothetical protein